jgi:hypothetical protein
MFIAASDHGEAPSLLMCIDTYLLFGDADPLTTYKTHDPPIESQFRTSFQLVLIALLRDLGTGQIQSELATMMSETDFLLGDPFFIIV